MNESFFLKIALFFSLIGIILLYLISRNIEINDTTIEKLMQAKENDFVSLKGVIKEIKNISSGNIYVLSEENTIQVFAFSDKSNFEIGDKINVKGKLSEYNGKKEIIADTIEKMN